MTCKQCELGSRVPVPRVHLQACRHRPQGHPLMNVKKRVKGLYNDKPYTLGFLQVQERKH